MFACFVSFTRHYKAGHLCFPLWFVGTFVHISGSASAAKATPFFYIQLFVYIVMYFLQDRLGPLPTSPAGFNSAVSAAVVQAAQAVVQRDLAVSTPVTTSTSAPVVIPSTTAFFQATQFQNSQQTPPTTPLSVSTVSSQDPLFTISDHFVNGNSSGTFTSVVNGNTNSLTTIQCRKINENSLVVSCPVFSNSKLSPCRVSKYVGQFEIQKCMLCYFILDSIYLIFILPISLKNIRLRGGGKIVPWCSIKLVLKKILSKQCPNNGSTWKRVL